MKVKSIIILITALSLVSCSSKVIDIWTDQSRLKEAKEFELKLSKESKFLKKYVTLSESMYPLVNEFKIVDPLIVKRAKSKFLPIYAEYFFSTPDSILRYISYDLEIDRYGNYNNKPAIWNEESLKLKEYNEHYENIKKQLIKQFRQPNVEDSGPQKTKSIYGGPDYLSRNTTWENDKTFMKLNMVFAENTYRIRLYYYWK